MSSIEHAYRRASWPFLLRGLVALAIGVLIVARPLDSVAAFALVIALWAIVSGIVQSVHALEVRYAFRSWWALLFSGVISIGFGIVALIFYPAVSLIFAVLWVSVWLVVGGLMALYFAREERAADVSWGWTFALGVLGIVIGIGAILYPAITLATLMGLIAGFALLSGVLLLTMTFVLRSSGGGPP